jgi:hypothetical protein
MHTRVFTMQDQLAFATLSGDYNPLHTDAVAARRLLFGRPVVHGIHLLFWALDCWLEESGTTGVPCELTLVLKKPAGVDEPVTLDATRRVDDGAELVVRVDGADCALLKLKSAPGAGTGADIPDGVPPAAEPCARAADALQVASGDLGLVLDRTRAATLFPRLTQRVPAAQLAVLLATTRVVGMQCPGLHSVFSELRLTFAGDAAAGPQLHYAVSALHQRLALVTMTISGAGAHGTIKAFLRPPPHEQARYAELRGRVAPDAFRSQRALVLGGSRGLGEVTAKLLAAGGADVRVTWHRGDADARRVVDDIRAGGGRAGALPWDVCDLHPHGPADWRPTHLYYFATPAIFTGVRGVFSPTRFRTFCAFYVDGLVRAVAALGVDANGLRHLFYPSSVAIDEVPADMAEYAAAKAAGEVVCRQLARQHPGLHVAVPRLPRTATDQTATLLPVRSVDPAELLLRHLGATG